MFKNFTRTVFFRLCSTVTTRFDLLTVLHLGNTEGKIDCSVIFQNRCD